MSLGLLCLFLLLAASQTALGFALVHVMAELDRKQARIDELDKALKNLTCVVTHQASQIYVMETQINRFTAPKIIDLTAKPYHPGQ